MLREIAIRSRSRVPDRSARNSVEEDKAMRSAGIAIVVLIALISGVLLAPLNYLVAERQALAQRALASGWPSVAATLLSPLAALSDARALNNLAVLRARGIGTEKNLNDARRLFARSADRGSVRARLNSVMLENGRCRLNPSRAADTVVSLEPIGGSDPAAASLVQDCLYFDATARVLPDRDQRSVAAAMQVQQTGDGDVLLHAGWALLNRARTTQDADFGDPGAERRYAAIVLPLAFKAMGLLFAAAQLGAASAYEPLGILAMQFGDKLGDDPLAIRLRERSNWEWLEVGAEKGDWAAQCRIADDRITHLRWDGNAYTRQAFDAVVALARNCIDRQEAPDEHQWYSQPEWLVVTPRLPGQARPILQIEATEAMLKGLLFFDADRQLNATAANGTPGRR
jgi:TPR repeat protein